jgi:hypothetical protein
LFVAGVMTAVRAGNLALRGFLRAAREAVEERARASGDDCGCVWSLSAMPGRALLP